ncbi:MAG: carbamoyl-phosphate synthase large subunit [Betaproteobacteria bacterium]|nr:carbamoyl-phosphate synthase large subunit [Betaproteobacteria bacterium]
MPARTDVKKILVLGSGPIQIGQGCEFDYSGTQACIALRELGYSVVLVNSNPATIMTDASTADRVYIEPLSVESVLSILEIEKPDALLPTVGGQVALNLFLELNRLGHLSRLGIKALGVSAETVILTEDRRAFRNMLVELGYAVIRGDVASSAARALAIAAELSFPLVVRSSFTLGGAGGGVVHSSEEFNALLERVFLPNVSAEVVIEESIVGWKEYELEVMRDAAGTFVVVCGVENINPMGVHTGDSITCAPCMTLTDREYQQLRNQAKNIFERVGMETGGANIQFAIHPTTGKIVVIEMNPRVSRSSALVSKATGYPIARLAAKLAVGMVLADLKNEITGQTTAAFEPAIDYVVVKIPRWDFAKYRGASQTLGVQMKSVGEVLAFGRTFRDAFQKAWRSLELGYDGWPDAPEGVDCRAQFSAPTPLLFPAIKSALRAGSSVETLHIQTGISKWFLFQMRELFELEERLKHEPLSLKLVHKAKQDGFTNAAIARFSGVKESEVEALLSENGLKPTFKMVDSCAAEFEAVTPYFYKTWDQHNDNIPSAKKKIVILGSGPNRIGQGVEFDYSCVHAVRAAQSLGYEVILINCNPETVSTDNLVSDKLFVEPLHEEDVLDILRAEWPEGVFVQFGGQSPLKLAPAILKAGFRILGTPQEVIELAENRMAFGEFVSRAGVDVPAWATGTEHNDCLAKAQKLGFPLLVRPSYVLGGQAMRVVWNEQELQESLSAALDVSQGKPVLLDRYLAGAIEYDIDLVCDGQDVFIPAIMEHVEEAGIHSGDSVSIIPCLRTDAQTQAEIRRVCTNMALQLGVCGLLNVQLARHAEKLFVIEVNPRSSRSVPFVSKATGIPLAEWGTLVALGVPLASLTAEKRPPANPCYAVKAPVFPFHKFPGVSPRLGPEMRSIGEVMGRASSPGLALARAYQAAGWQLKCRGQVFILCEPQQLHKLDAPLNVLVREIGLKLSLGGDEESASQALMQGELALVFFCTENASDHLRMCAERIGALAIQHGIPFLDSPFALDSWVMALSAKDKIESPFPLLQEH